MESKTALIMANGTLVNTLKALQKNIKNDNDFKKLVEYFLDGKLKDWLNERYGYEKEIKALEEVDKDDPDFTCKLCKAIGIDYTSSEPVNVALIEYEMRIRKALKKVTSENAVIVNAGCTASNQSELDFLIKNGKKIIYLWGDSFKLPIEHNISYIGILGKPSVNIELPNLEAVESYGIKLENVNLPESILRAEEEKKRKAEEEARRKAEEENKRILEEAIRRLLEESMRQLLEEKRKAEEEVRRNPFKNAKVGACVKFGNYPQTANGDFQPIEWQVLEKKNNKMLVVSKYGLEARRFDSSSNNWKNSEIRKFLNVFLCSFYDIAFNENEKSLIRHSNNISTDVYHKKIFWQYEKAIVLTDDYLFLLSKEEAEKYFANNDVRICKATEYAVKNGDLSSAYVRFNINDFSWRCSWWLRSASPNDSNCVYLVNCDGNFCYDNVDNSYYLVRPALWINI